VTHVAEASRPLSARDPRLAPFSAFMRAYASVARRLDDDLQAEHGMSLQEYGALLYLAWAPERRLRMSRLADGLVLSKSGVTRLVDRLVADGLVERRVCPTDARGAEAHITPAGVERLRAAAPTHLRGIGAYFLDVVEAADLATLARALSSVAASGGVPDPLTGDLEDDLR
jgi:DNA-binding MarR family transcriptional regulator